jgi:hypothetical protein
MIEAACTMPSLRERGQASPDDGDAMALTFAAPVLPPAKEEYLWLGFLFLARKRRRKVS